MEITKFLVTGDLHADFSRFYKIHNMIPEGELWGVIILGDASVNFWLNKRDKKLKQRINTEYPNLRFFCVRGNHEARPEDIEGMKKVFYFQINNYTYWEEEFPNIYYLLDGHEYIFDNKKALVIGGAYSVDKWYRLERQAAGYYAGWFANEQLTQDEMNTISALFKGQSYDLVLAHTCPLSYQPIDLFLSCINQETVDNSMEIWLEEFIHQIDFKQFLFGHYHDDRIVNEKARMLYHNIIELNSIV